MPTAKSVRVGDTVAGPCCAVGTVTHLRLSDGVATVKWINGQSVDVDVRLVAAMSFDAIIGSAVHVEFPYPAAPCPITRSTYHRGTVVSRYPTSKFGTLAHLYFPTDGTEHDLDLPELQEALTCAQRWGQANPKHPAFPFERFRVDRASLVGTEIHVFFDGPRCPVTLTEWWVGKVTAYTPGGKAHGSDDMWTVTFAADDDDVTTVRANVPIMQAGLRQAAA